MALGDSLPYEKSRMGMEWGIRSWAFCSEAEDRGSLWDQTAGDLFWRSGFILPVERQLADVRKYHGGVALGSEKWREAIQHNLESKFETRGMGVQLPRGCGADDDYGVDEERISEQTDLLAVGHRLWFEQGP